MNISASTPPGSAQDGLRAEDITRDVSGWMSDSETTWSSSSESDRNRGSSTDTFGDTSEDSELGAEGLD